MSAPDFRNIEQIVAEDHVLTAELAALVGTQGPDAELPREQIEAFRVRVEAFLQRVAKAGVWLYYDTDRVTAVGRLSSWVNELYRLGAYRAGARPPRLQLAQFAPELQPELREEDYPYLVPGQDPAGRTVEGVWQRHLTLCLERLRPPAKPNEPWIRLLVIAGAAGSGRTSLLRQALAPALARETLKPGSVPVVPLEPFQPGRRPLESLKRHLQAAGLPFAGTPSALVEAWRTVTPPRALLIDRLEDLFTLGVPSAEQATFLEMLRQLATDPGSQHIVVAVFEGEYIGRLAQFDSFFAAAGRGLLSVNLDSNELKQLIVEPARKAGLFFEEGLPEQLVADIQGDPAAVTLVQFTLRRLWKRRERNTIPWQAYRELCSGRLALDLAATETLDRFAEADPANREHRIEVVRAVFLALIRPEAGGGVRVRPLASAPLAQRVLASWPKQSDARPPTAAELETAVEFFCGEQLLLRKPGGAITLAHEALVTRWQKLVEWIEIERARVRERAVLRADAEHWEAARKKSTDPKRADALLYPALKLAQWEGVRDELRGEAEDPDDPGYGGITLEFLDASAAAAARADFWHRVRWIAAAAAVALLLAAIWWRQQERQRERLRTEAQNNMMLYVNRGATQLAEGDPAGALLWFAEARSKERETSEPVTAEAHGTSLGIALRQLPRLSEYLGTEGLTTADLSPDGRYALLSRRRQGGKGGGVLLWSLQQPDAPATALVDGPTATRAVFSPDGRRAAIALGEPGEKTGVLEIWDMEVEPPRRLSSTPFEAALTDVAFSPEDSEVVAVCGTSDGRAQGEVWLCKSAAEHLEAKQLAVGGENGPANCLTFSRDGELLAVGHKIGDSGGRVRVFKVNNPPLPRATEDSEELRPVVRLSFSQDAFGSLLAVATHDSATNRGDARLYRYDRRATGPLPRTLPPLVHEDGGGIADLAFSPAGSRPRLLTASTGGSVQIWDPGTGRSLARLMHDGWAFAAAWSPDGGKVATGSRDRTARLWDANTGELALPPLDHGGTVTALRFTPDSTRLLTITLNNARVWETQPRERSLLPVPSVPIATAATISPSGNYLAAAPEALSRWGHLLLFRLGARAEPVARLDADKEVRLLAISADDRWVAATNAENKLLLWTIPEKENFDWKVPKPIVALAAPAQVIGFAGTIPGRVFVVREPAAKNEAEKEARTVVEVFDLATGAAVRPTALLPFRVNVATASADGEQLALGGGTLQPREGFAAVLATSTATPPQLLTGKSARDRPLAHDEIVQALAFSPDGKALVTGGIDDAVCVWDLPAGTERWAQRQKHTADVTSVAFSPSGKLVLSTSFDSTAVVRNARTGAEVTTVQHRGTVRSGVFGPRDESYFATAGDDRTARLWRVTGDSIAVLPHTCDVSRVSFDEPQTVLLTSGLQKPTALGDTPRALEFRRWRIHPESAEPGHFRSLGQMLGSRTFGQQRLRLLPPVDLAKLWPEVRPDEHREWTPEGVQSFHFQEARLAENAGDRASAAWHLQRRLPRAEEARGDLDLLQDEVRAQTAVGAWDRVIAAAELVMNATNDDDRFQDMLEARANARLRRGRLQRNEADIQGALADYQEIVQRDPDGPFWRTMQAETLIQLKRFEEAAAALQEAIKIKAYPGHFQKLAAVQLRLRDLASADPAKAAAFATAYETTCSEAMRLFPKLPQSGQVAWCAVLGGASTVDWEKIGSEVKSAIQEMPQSYLRRNTHGAVLHRRGGPENRLNAIVQLDESAKLYDRTPGEAHDPLAPPGERPPGRPIDWMLLALAHLALSSDATLPGGDRALHAREAARYRAAVGTIVDGNRLEEFGASRVGWNRLDLEVLLAEYDRQRGQ
jgi:WD40 repeat protein/tetratricopeptide (TPR) repeat protein